MIEITDQPFNASVRLAAFQARLGPDMGAVVSFVGRVRGAGGDALILSHYPQMCAPMIQQWVEAAQRDFGPCAIDIVHRIGTMGAGEDIVMVLVAAPHRRAAFLACDFLMDHLKTQAPFFKQARINGRTDWIEPRADDYHDLSRWHKGGKDGDG